MIDHLDYAFSQLDTFLKPILINIILNQLCVTLRQNLELIIFFFVCETFQRNNKYIYIDVHEYVFMFSLYSHKTWQPLLSLHVILFLYSMLASTRIQTLQRQHFHV